VREVSWVSSVSAGPPMTPRWAGTHVQGTKGAVAAVWVYRNCGRRLQQLWPVNLQQGADIAQASEQKGGMAAQERLRAPLSH